MSSAIKRILSKIRRQKRPGHAVNSDGYTKALDEEINNYSQVENIHDLPAIYHYWSNNFLQPHFQSSGFSTIPQFFANGLNHRVPDNARFLSVGSGYCETEIEVATELKSQGLRNFSIECLELKHHLLERAEIDAAQAGVSNHLVLTQGDFNEWTPPHTFDGVMANHSLHHVTSLEFLFDNV